MACLRHQRAPLAHLTSGYFLIMARQSASHAFASALAPKPNIAYPWFCDAVVRANYARLNVVWRSKYSRWFRDLTDALIPIVSHQGAALADFQLNQTAILNHREQLIRQVYSSLATHHLRTKCVVVTLALGPT